MHSLYSLYPFSRPQPGTTGRLAFWLVAILSAAAFLLPLTVLAAASPKTNRVANCSWDHPGVNPFMGELPAAVDRYTDIPADVRARLKQRMARRDYDDIAVIRRDSIEGKSSYEPAIRDMHFGTDRVCSNVSRSAWAPGQQERGLVYCEGAQCLIVPTVCRNVSRVTRRPAAPVAAAEAPPADELVFDPPSAGPVADSAAPAPGGPVGGGGGSQYPQGIAFAPGGFGAPVGTAGLLDGPTYGSAGREGSADPGPRFGDPTGGPPPAAGSHPTDPGRILAGLPEGGIRFPSPSVPVPLPASVSPVPEPGTWALMILGLGGVLLARRSKNAAQQRR